MVDAAAEPAKPVVARHGWQVDVTGYIQVDAVPWSDDSVDEVNPATGEPLNSERLLIRRGRLRLEAKHGELFGGLELDGNTLAGTPAARLLGAQVGWHYAPLPDQPPLVTVTAGLFRTPFGNEVPASERDKPFLEAPAFARALFPGNYDAGVMANGGYGVARWAIAVTNGAVVGDTQWRGRDPSASYDLIAHLGAVIDTPRKSRVEVGASALAGKGLHRGTPPTKDELQWVDENQDGIVQITELRVIPGSTGTPSESYRHNALGVDARVHWCLCRLGTGFAFAEAALATNLDRGVVYADPIARSRDLRELGFAVGVVQSFGAHLVGGVRYDRYNADRDAFENEGVELVNVDQVFSTWSVMVSGRWRDARVLVQFDHERNPFGRGDNGMPTTRSADRVSLRAQVGF